MIPIDGQSIVLAAIWVDGYGVMLLERIEEVSRVGGGKELDAKVIYSEGGGGRQDCVGPKTRGVCHRSLSVRLEVAHKAFVGDDAGFLESVHPLSGINVDVATRVSDG